MPAEPVQRRLAAILAADVAGYSRLMGEDEEGTLATLTAHLTELIEPCIAEHSGRVVKTTGDGLLAEFASVVDAVRCAVAFQEGMRERNSDTPEDRRIDFRIGVNLGDVIVQDDDVYGDGVNIAARLEGIAEPGGICISGTVFDQIGKKLDLAIDDLGSQSVKNIAEPVRTYRVRIDDVGSAPEHEVDALPLPDKPSIAVLPFENMSGDPEQGYFADGIAEDIMTALARLKWLFVIARNSSFIYKGRNVDVRQIGRELGVRYVLEGSVRKAGNRLRITGQLIVAETGNHIWAEKYDGEFADVFELQDQITEGVLGAIEPSVRQAEIQRSRRKHPDSLGAYDLYLRAVEHAWAFDIEATSKAIDLLEQALLLDPTYAAARGLAAWCYLRRNRFGGSDSADLEAGVRHARAVLARGTDDSAALAQAAFVIANLERDYDAALNAVGDALALTPNSAIVLIFSATVHSFTGKFDLAIDQAERCLRLSPFDPIRYQAYVAMAYAHFFTDAYEEAAKDAQRAVQCEPSFGPGFAVLAASLACLGRLQEARAAVDHLLTLNPSMRVSHYVGARRFDPANNEKYAAALRKAGLPE